MQATTPQEVMAQLILAVVAVVVDLLPGLTLGTLAAQAVAV
jgi:hypothetical protein